MENGGTFFFALRHIEAFYRNLDSVTLEWCSRNFLVCSMGISDFKFCLLLCLKIYEYALESTMCGYSGTHCGRHQVLADGKQWKVQHGKQRGRFTGGTHSFHSNMAGFGEDSVPRLMERECKELPLRHSIL